jgi:hypothetical protein
MNSTEKRQGAANVSVLISHFEVKSQNERQTAKIQSDLSNPLDLNLSPSLSLLIGKLSERREDRGQKYVDFHWRLSILPYCLAATYRAYLRFAAEARTLVETHRKELSVGRLGLAASQVYGLCFAIDAFLDAGRRSQNALIPYLIEGFKRSLPESFNDLVKRIEADPTLLPEPLAKVLLDYWTGSGKTLKFYRDISQHHALVAESTTLFCDSAGKVGLQTLLPNVSNDSKLSNLSWGNPPVHAQHFLKHQLRQLVGTTHFVMRILCDLVPGEPAAGGGMYFRNPMKIGSQIDGYTPQTDQEIAAEVLSVLKVVDAMPLPSISL